MGLDRDIPLAELTLILTSASALTMTSTLEVKNINSPDMINIYCDIAIGPKIWVILGEILHIYYI